MSRIYVSPPYIEKRPTEAVEIQCPTGSDLTTSERQAIQELLASRFRTHRLYNTHDGRQRSAARLSL
jgi:hypothetical protein